MTTRWSLRVWVMLSALAVILLFATVAAEAMLQGTRPPATSAASRLGIAGVTGCPDGQLCRTAAHARKATRATASEQCPTLRFDTI